MSHVYPTLRYHNAVDAITWLRDVFGFEPVLIVPGENGAVLHAELRMGHGFVLVGSTRDDGPRQTEPEDLASLRGTYVQVDDVDAHYARAEQGGAEILYGLRDTEYGSREYAARDVEGYAWFFGTYTPGTYNAG